MLMNIFYLKINIFLHDLVLFSTIFMIYERRKVQIIQYFRKQNRRLLADIPDIPDFFLPIKQKLKNVRNFFRKRKINQLESSLLFALQQKKIDYFIIGIDSYKQFEQITRVLRKRKTQRTKLLLESYLSKCF